MAKILSKSGDSLADAYDVEGSIAGIETLRSEEVNLVHDMGGTIFSERLSGTILSFSTGAILQNITFNVVFTLGQPIIRLLGVRLYANNGGRTLRASVAITDLPPTISDMVVLSWTTGDPEKAIQVSIDGTISTQLSLEPTQPSLLPNLMIGLDNPSPSPVLSLRGVTAGFGAGTVIVTCVAYFAFPVLRGLSSRGLPIPAW